MTRKDYELIAAAIRRASDAPGYAERNKFVSMELADALYRDNPRFDRSRFLAACGVPAPVVTHRAPFDVMRAAGGKGGAS